MSATNRGELIHCADCGQPIPPGAPYRQIPTSIGPEHMGDLQVIVEVLCPDRRCEAA